MSHIDDLLFDTRLSGFISVDKLEYTTTRLTTESLTLSWTESMSVNLIRITAGTMDSDGSHGNASNRGRITQDPTIQRHHPKIEKLENFIENAKANKMCDFWDSIDELAMKVAVALPKVMRRTPQIGWVRGDQATSTEVSNELAELSTENRKLREKLREYESQLQSDTPILFLSMINENLTLNLSRLNETQQYIPLIKRDDIPSELNQYISDDDIKKYNKNIPSKEKVDTYNQQVFLYENYINHSITFTPIIENRGKKVATDIYVEIEFPEFLTFTNDDDDGFFTKKPELNIPKTPIEIARNKIKAKEAIDIIRQSLSVSGGGGMAGLDYLNDRESLLKSIKTNVNYPILNRTQWIDFDGCKITLRAKKIIQSLSLEFESITIIPKCEGEGLINFKIICEELKEPIIYSYQVSVK